MLIHGMWMTPLSWEHWASHYRDRGHHVLAPAWPRLESEPEQLRRDPSPLRNLSITDVIDHYDKIIRGLGRPPIIIGHSFGGLFTQLLADRGLGVAAVALGIGAPKGVLRLPYSTTRAAWPALGNPANLKKEAPLTLKQFHWCFTNALSREESDAVYQRYYIPGSARPFFQAGFANFNPKGVTKVDYRNPARAASPPSPKPATAPPPSPTTPATSSPESPSPMGAASATATPAARSPPTPTAPAISSKRGTLGSLLSISPPPCSDARGWCGWVVEGAYAGRQDLTPVFHGGRTRHCPHGELASHVQPVS